MIEGIRVEGGKGCEFQKEVGAERAVKEVKKKLMLYRRRCWTKFQGGVMERNKKMEWRGGEGDL